MSGASSENKEKPSRQVTSYRKPEGASREIDLSLTGKNRKISSEANWIILRKDEKPSAEMFFIRYSLHGEKAKKRPITFVFNGGPGASSAYLHMGALGPKMVKFNADGTPLPVPVRMSDNPETWLEFTDLVFIDPIGTGFSRMIKDEEEKKDFGDKKKDKNEYYNLKKDLDSLGEFIRKFLSKYHRWESPVFIAGESYGGFRVGKLAKLLQKEYGVGLAGSILISPALEFTLLDSSDYDVLRWVDTFPTMAVSAYIHKKNRKKFSIKSPVEYMSKAEDFALKELIPALASGDLYPSSKMKTVLNSAADFIGIPRNTLQLKNGRIQIEYFVKNLLRNEKKLLGLYDASLTEADPFPDRDNHEGPDPTLHSIERIFASGINTQLRKNIGLDTERDYNLLSMDVNENWKIEKQHALQTQVGATDDLRFGMSLNPDMEVMITHGLYDLVTPYFSTKRITALMKLTPKQKAKLTLKNYQGGHMYYTWEKSRKAFYSDIKSFYKKALK